MSKILRCKKCGDIIQSTHRHDMVWCKCGAIAIDGGDDYCKISGNLEDMEFLAAEKDLNDMFIRCMQILGDKDKEIAMLEKALELAVNELEDAKDMLRECGKNDWANTLNTSADYFKTKAKEMMKDE